jgi:O-glycosyl hydrolase
VNRSLPRALYASLLIAGLAVAVFGLLPARPGAFVERTQAADGTATLTVDGARRFQRIDGLGVNANPRSWKGGELRPALDTLVDQLGASAWRVIVENADWEARNDDANPNTFDWTYYGSVYQSSRFQDAWDTLDYLNQKGAPQIMLNVMGHVPEWMGNTAVDPRAEDEWVEMIASLVCYARSACGAQNPHPVHIDLLSPMNETDLGYPEGPRVSAAQQVRLLHKLALRLDALGLGDLRLVAPETASVRQGVDTYIPALLADPIVMAKIDHFALHSYAGDSGGADGVIKRSAYPDRDFWMTEWAGACGGCDTGRPVAGEWAHARSSTDFLLRHLQAGAAGALVYDAYDSFYEHHGSVGFWGQLAYDAGTGTYAPRKRLYTNAQVFRFVAPGAVRVAADVASAFGLQAVAFYDPRSGQATVVGQNPATTPATVTVTLAGLPPIDHFALYQTTADPDVNLQRLADVPAANGTFSFQVGGDSFFTLTTAAPPPATPGSPATPAITQSNTPARVAETVPSAVTRTSPAPPGATLLVGESRVLDDADTNPSGQAEAFRFVATASGTVSRLALYVDPGSTAPAAVIGLYREGADGAPGALLTQGTVSSPEPGAWSFAAVPAASITGGTAYWIAVLGPVGAGELRFRDAGATGGSSQTSARTDLATLPATWSPGKEYASSPLSAYAVADAAPPAGEPAAAPAPAGEAAPAATGPQP